MIVRWAILSLFLIFCSACDETGGVTPLMKAAKAGDTQVLTQLITGGADVNRQSDYGWTALIFASWQGHAEIVEILIEAGADVNAATKSVSPGFMATSGGYPVTNALSEAIKEGHIAIANTLLDRGARIDANSMALAGGNADILLLKRILTLGGEVNEIGSGYYRTALSFASFKGNLVNMKWLLENGADPNLDIAETTNISQVIRGFQPDAVALLIKNGADPNQKYGSESYELTALWGAIYAPAFGKNYTYNLEAIEILLKNGADPHYRNDTHDRTMLEHVERSRLNSSQGSIDPKYDAATQNRYLQSAIYDGAIVDLLSAYQK